MASRDPNIKRTQSHLKELTAWEVQGGQSGEQVITTLKDTGYDRG